MLKFTLRAIDIHIQWGAHVAPTTTGYQLLVNSHHDGARRRSRTLRRTTYQRVEQETLHGVHTGTIGDLADVSGSGGHVDCSSTILRPEKRPRVLTICSADRCSREAS